MFRIGQSHVSLLDARDIERHQRIAVQVGVNRGADGLFHARFFRFFFLRSAGDEQNRQQYRQTHECALDDLISPAFGSK